MNKKYVQVIIIVIAFGASGFVLYNGFFKNDDKAALNTVATTRVPGGPASGGPASGGPGNLPTATQIGSVDVNNFLPYGTKLDYTILDKNNLQPVGLTKVKLDFNRDVGIPESNLITPSNLGQ